MELLFYLFIVDKYEEIYLPELKDHLDITNQAKEILNMEMNILKELKFDIGYTSSLRYLEMFLGITKYIIL